MTWLIVIIGLVVNYHIVRGFFFLNRARAHSRTSTSILEDMADNIDLLHSPRVGIDRTRLLQKHEAINVAFDANMDQWKMDITNAKHHAKIATAGAALLAAAVVILVVLT